MSSDGILLRIGTRKSQLAMAQTLFVKDLLAKHHADKALTFDIVGISTVGDRVLDVALSKIGEKSLFTKELEVALAQNEVDAVVHSLKDLPTLLPPGMVVGAILEREDPRDAVVLHPKHKGKTLATLPQGATIGTSSLRRAAQLRSKFPSFKFADIRGNLNTRLKKLDEAEDFDAIILAVAGLVRLGWKERIGEIIEKDVSLHAVGQGALAVECREGDAKTLELLKSLSHYPTTVRCNAERAFLRKLEGGCSVPIGVFTIFDEATGHLSLEGGVFSLDGQQQVFGSISETIHDAEQAKHLGTKLAEELLARGAQEILAEILRKSGAPHVSH